MSTFRTFRQTWAGRRPSSGKFGFVGVGVVSGRLLLRLLVKSAGKGQGDIRCGKSAGSLWYWWMRDKQWTGAPDLSQDVRLERRVPTWLERGWLPP